jgi:phthalate 4,5-dioxygenase oxygenase subunit
MPLFPNYEWFLAPEDHLGITKFLNECNYLQGLEGDCDSPHLDYLHRGNNGEGLALRRSGAPTFEFEETWFGFRAAALRRAGEDNTYVRTSVFVMPCIGCVPVGRVIDGKLDGLQAVYQVPADDFTTWRYNVRLRRSGPMWPEDLHAHRKQVGPDYQKLAKLSNDFLIDRARQRAFNYSGMEGFATQDACVTESMGPICDRTQEHLGMSDLQVLGLRKKLLSAVQGAARGLDPGGLVYEAAENEFSGAACMDAMIPAGARWQDLYVDMVETARTASNRP